MAEEQWKTNWKELSILGAGWQGTTRKVASLANPAQVGVLKLSNWDNDEQARARMAHEAINLETLAKVGVTKVPALIEHNTQHFGDKGVQLYIVMEFVAGETLDHVVNARGGPLTVEQSVAITRDLCSTISAMHAID